MSGMKLKLIINESDEPKEDVNPNQALGDNSILNLPDQTIDKVTNRGGISTILTPAGILTTDSKQRGW